MTVLFQDDFEDGFAPYNDYVKQGTSTLEISSAVVRTGSHSLHILLPIGNGKWAYARKGIASQMALYLAGWVRFVSLPTAAQWFSVFGVGSSASDTLNRHAIIGVDFAGGNPRWMVRYYTGAAQAQDTLLTEVVATATWYQLKLKVVVGDGSGEVRAYVNGAEKMTHTSLLNSSVGGLAWLAIGEDIEPLAPISAVEYYLDTVEASTQDISYPSTDPSGNLTSAPFVYPTVEIEEAVAKYPSRSSIVVYNHGARVRTVRHSTPISPWVAGT